MDVDVDVKTTLLTPKEEQAELSVAGDCGRHCAPYLNPILGSGPIDRYPGLRTRWIRKSVTASALSFDPASEPDV